MAAAMNRNTGRYYANLYLDQMEGYELGDQGTFYIKVTEWETGCELLVFEPTMPGENWNILILKYGPPNYKEPGKFLHTAAKDLAAKLGTEVTYDTI